MSRQLIRETLERIANDPDFRQALIAAPVDTLAGVGITINPADVPVDGIVLPSNDEILAHLDEWTEQIWNLESSGNHMPKVWLGFS